MLLQYYTPKVDVVFSLVLIFQPRRAGAPGSHHRHRQLSGSGARTKPLYLYLAQVSDQSEASMLSSDQSES